MQHLDDRVYLDLLRVRCGMRPALTTDALLLRQHGETAYPRLVVSQWCEEFEARMRNRLIMGRLRYGNELHGKRTQAYDVPGYIEKKLKRYADTGDLEALVDIAALAMVEYTGPQHPKAHWGECNHYEHAEKR